MTNQMYKIIAAPTGEGTFGAALGGGYQAVHESYGFLATGNTPEEAREAAEIVLTAMRKANRAVPDSYVWMSVETPSFFRERKFPACDADWSEEDEQAYDEMRDDAERYGTYVHRSSYERG